MNINEEIAMNINEEIADVLLSDKSVFFLFWSEDQDWMLINSGNLLLDKDKIKIEGLRGLKPSVLEDDEALFETFLERLDWRMARTKNAVFEMGNHIKAFFRFKSLGNTHEFYSVECRMKADESGVVQKLLVRIQELEAEDVYRIQLAQIITDDDNPAVFTQGVASLLEKYPDRKFAFVQFDVAQFKTINEQYGADFGDELLEYFIHTLRFVCHKEQLYVRLTADIFMILTPYETQKQLLDFIDYLREHLSGYKGIAYRLVFGVSEIEDKKGNLRIYGDGAAFARQSIKSDALNYVAFYKDEMRDSARIGKFIEDNMENALAGHEFVMYLQPKFSISEEKVIGAEALVRWVHSERGIIPPMEFIPVFEKNGFIVKMDAYIWEEACKAIRTWIDLGIQPVPISVNLSRRHLRDTVFIKILDALIDKYNIPKKYLEIEITESVEESEINDGVGLLKSNGYTLLMDDFGSGYSSLNMLKDTQFDIIKIDRAFLQDFIVSDRGQSIVEHTIRMTKEIGLDLVAEGVETKEQAMFLSNCGCDVAQGFYYAKPMTLEEFNKKYLK